MHRATLIAVLLTSSVPALAGGGPSMDDVVRSPADYAGRTLQFTGATMSGTITKYDVGGVRKYYLTVSSGRNLDAGFFLAPPAVADQLYDKMNPRRNYAVNITCRVEKIVINDVPQWHGIVKRVDFLDGDGQVVDTVKQGK